MLFDHAFWHVIISWCSDYIRLRYRPWYFAFKHTSKPGKGLKWSTWINASPQTLCSCGWQFGWQLYFCWPHHTNLPVHKEALFQQMGQTCISPCSMAQLWLDVSICLPLLYARVVSLWSDCSTHLSLEHLALAVLVSSGNLLAHTVKFSSVLLSLWPLWLSERWTQVHASQIWACPVLPVLPAQVGRGQGWFVDWGNTRILAHTASVNTHPVEIPSFSKHVETPAGPRHGVEIPRRWCQSSQAPTGQIVPWEIFSEPT